MPDWCEADEWCPITATSDIIGKRWHPIIIHRLLQHRDLGFNRMKEELPGISNKVLSESLDDLRRKNVIEKEIVKDNPKRVKYCLTAKGQTLKPVIMAMGEWAEDNLN